MDIRFVSSNSYKIAETVEIMKGSSINIIPFQAKIEELQTLDVEMLVKDKLLKAFQRIGRPLFVEHTGLYIKYLNDFPGGLTQIFWDSLLADKFAELVGHMPDKSVIAKTIVGYCDGHKIYYFKGEVNGIISNTPKGNRSFQWDCVFIPDTHNETFAEMGGKKNDISMRKQALENFKLFLTK